MRVCISVWQCRGLAHCFYNANFIYLFIGSMWLKNFPSCLKVSELHQQRKMNTVVVHLLDFPNLPVETGATEDVNCWIRCIVCYLWKASINSSTQHCSFLASIQTGVHTGIWRLLGKINHSVSLWWRNMPPSVALYRVLEKMMCFYLTCTLFIAVEWNILSLRKNQQRC